MSELQFLGPLDAPRHDGVEARIPHSCRGTWKACFQIIQVLVLPLYVCTYEYPYCKPTHWPGFFPLPGYKSPFLSSKCLSQLQHSPLLSIPFPSPPKPFNLPCIFASSSFILPTPRKNTSAYHTVPPCKPAHRPNRPVSRFVLHRPGFSAPSVRAASGTPQTPPLGLRGLTGRGNARCRVVVLYLVGTVTNASCS
jgi:hypothetical protein